MPAKYNLAQQPVNSQSRGFAGRRQFLLSTLGLAALLAGCKPAAVAPEEPVWGKQPCAHCVMLLSERQHGAQAQLHNGERHYFDDPGCLVAWQAERQAEIAGRWVRRYDQPAAGIEWLEASSAKYVKVAHTPMGFGFVAVVDPASADGAGTVFTWDQVAQAVRAKLEGTP